MPVGIPTPRHRIPSAHNTVSSMREMMYEENPGEPPPPWTQQPGGWPMSWNQPPPPPPPQWNQQQPPPWGHHHMPHPSLLTGGAPPPPPPAALAHEEEEYDDDYDSQEDQPEERPPYGYPQPPPPPHASYAPPPMPPHMPPMPPPPPGFNPYAFAYSYANGAPPPPPPAWAAQYPTQTPPEEVPEEELQEDLQVDPQPRTTRRRKHRAEEEERQAMLDDLISKMRSTSPSRRQIAKLQRIICDARETSTSGGSSMSGLTEEQQYELEALQELHHQQHERAARRQATHEETVREIQSETRGRQSTRRSPAPATAKPRYTGITSQKTSSAHRTTSATRSKSLPHQVPTPQTRSTVTQKTKRMRKPSVPIAGGRNAQFVKETHDRLRKQSERPSQLETSHADEAHDPILSFLRKEVIPQHTKTKKSRPSTMSHHKKHNTSAEGCIAPTERDYMEGLEDLHQKLRKTYMEIQKHPQRFLSQLTTHGTIGGDAHVQSAAELLADQEIRRSASPSHLMQPMQGINHHTKAKVSRVRGEMDALEAQWDQLVSNYDIVGERDE